jgi:hypothetical protein
MMEDGMNSSLRGSVEDFVALGGIPTRAMVSSMWESSLAPDQPFVSMKLALE